MRDLERMAARYTRHQTAAEALEIPVTGGSAMTTSTFDTLTAARELETAKFSRE